MDATTYSALGQPGVGFWGNLISATVGAILVIVVYRAIAGRRTSY